MKRVGDPWRFMRTHMLERRPAVLKKFLPGIGNGG